MESLFPAVKPFQPNVEFHIETSHLFSTENLMTGFYMNCNAGLKWVKLIVHILKKPVKFLEQ